MGGLTQERPGSVPADNPSAHERAGSVPAPADNPSAAERRGSLLADNPPGSSSLGFYIHVPFCAQRCGYCSFNTARLEDAAMGRYLDALQRELDLLGALAWAPDIRVTTVFFGGGTPSLLAPAELAAILERLGTRFEVARDAEVTVECNPESVTRPRLEGYRAAGVNRVSLGVQSLDDALLQRLGRLHDARGARAAFAAAREAGFTNVSVDLMYGLPWLDTDGFASTLEAVLDWEPEHLSAYALTLDAGSRWAAEGVSDLPREQTVVDQYWRLAGAAAARDFEHYEVSNYARPGFRARHNLVYWRGAEYLCAGPGACGFVGSLRYANVRGTARWCETLERGALPVDASETLTPRQRLAERLILGLRTADGVPRAWLDERLDGDARLRRHIASWRERRLLGETGDRVWLSEEGFLLSDALFVELL